MKTLSFKDCQQVSGGEQALSITSRVVFEGIPENCVVSFFDSHKDNFASYTLDNLDSSIIAECVDFDKSNYAITMDAVPVNISVIEI